jgi:hypothetical protein
MASKCSLIFALLAVAFIGTARAEFKGLATRKSSPGYYQAIHGENGQSGARESGITHSFVPAPIPPAVADIIPARSCKITKADKAEFFMATVPSLFWKEGDACGQCINVAYGKGRDLKDPIKVKIVGECTDCTNNNIELGQKGMNALGGGDVDTKFVQWEFVSCVDVAKDTSSTGRVASVATKKVASRKMLTSEQ